jgi:hypothetical protein
MFGFLLAVLRLGPQSTRRVVTISYVTDDNKWYQSILCYVASTKTTFMSFSNMTYDPTIWFHWFKEHKLKTYAAICGDYIYHHNKLYDLIRLYVLSLFIKDCLNFV